MNAETTMTIGAEAFELLRVPNDPSLRAWDAADLYLLDHLREMSLPENARVLVLFDAFGALACGLHRFQRESFGDSHLSQLALRRNELRNFALLATGCPWSPLDDAVEAPFDVAIVKVPREKALLEYGLSAVREKLVEGAPVIGAGMSRHVHTSTLQAFEKWMGPVTTSLARQKSRLILSTASRPVAGRLAPAVVEHGEQSLVVHAGVFSHRFLDPGTSMLLRHVPRWTDGGARKVFVDAGCGAGVLAMEAARRNPEARGIATDESHLAVRSTRENLERAGISGVDVRVDDVVASVENVSVDLVLANPPQHQAAAVSQQMLARFVEEAHRVLRPGGEVRMVANRHVNLNVALRSGFRDVRILEQDRRFMVCAARRQR